MKTKGMIFIVLFVFAMAASFFIGRLSIYPSSETNKKPLYWIDPMEPQVHYPGPGKSHMGMELIPVYEEKSSNEPGIEISPSVINNLGVRIAKVKKETLARAIDTVGYVKPNENQISHIHTYADGWIKKLWVKAVGDKVRAHQVVMQLYSPELVNAQEEYLIALDSNNPSLITASLKKLQALHISEEQIKQLKITRKASQVVDIYSHQDGVVVDLNVREGMRVTPETEMMNIVDLASIWIIAEVFEEEANWVSVGEPAVAQLPAFPGKTWKGTVEYVYPQIDPVTRTLKVRFLFPNPDILLKPNMYANVTILAQPTGQVLTIPIEALIRGASQDRVIVALNQGHFESRVVTIGIESGNRIEILSGLKEGEQVVTSGQFLIDSESNLNASMQRLETKKSKNQNNQEPKPIKGQGVVQTIDMNKQNVTLAHEALPDLNWPAMTMRFKVDKNVNLNAFKKGDTVEFSLQKKGEEYVIETMSPVNKEYNP
ncbi:TPA: efflux RND transporter periplasmic adaptor subunit [Legionella pneumophila]